MTPPFDSMPSYFLAPLAFLALAPASAFAAELSLQAHAERVATFLEGTMDSSIQSLEDKAYLDVTVRHCRVTLAEESPAAEGGAILLYVEQAISANKARPYRQRFVRVAANPSQGTVTSTIFENDLAKRFAGLCDKAAGERVVPVAGFEVGKCTVSLRPVEDAYVGSTPPLHCPSSYRGAVGVSSKVELGATYMNSWDQGWAADGTQAWGATKGPYQFRKGTPGMPTDAEAVALAGTLTGLATNEAQVQAAPADFASVKNDVCQVKLAGATTDRFALTLYVEQDVQAGGRAIVRQRVYEIDRDAAGKLRLFSHGIETTDGDALKGLCRTAVETRTAPAGLPIALTRDETCPLTFMFDAQQDGFVGRTPIGGCASSYAGAVKLEIEELLKDDAYRVWERWYDQAGNQVAGSKTGPYLYVRK